MSLHCQSKVIHKMVDMKSNAIFLLSLILRFLHLKWSLSNWPKRENCQQLSLGEFPFFNFVSEHFPWWFLPWSETSRTAKEEVENRVKTFWIDLKLKKSWMFERNRVEMMTLVKWEIELYFLVPFRDRRQHFLIAIDLMLVCLQTSPPLCPSWRAK